MTKATRQRFTSGGVRRRTVDLQDNLRKPVHPLSTNPALENAMRPFLAELTIPQRDAVRLVFWERMSTWEAADALGITQAALRERLQGAATKLRKLLSEAADSEEYAKIRQWLTPAAKVDKQGRVDLFEDARCVDCGTPLAKYKPNGLGLAPKLLCPDDAATTRTLRAHAAAADGSIP